MIERPPPLPIAARVIIGVALTAMVLTAAGILLVTTMVSHFGQSPVTPSLPAGEQEAAKLADDLTVEMTDWQVTDEIKRSGAEVVDLRHVPDGREVVVALGSPTDACYRLELRVDVVYNVSDECA